MVLERISWVTIHISPIKVQAMNVNSLFHNMTQIILDLNKSVCLCTADRQRERPFGAVLWGACSNVWVLCNSTGPSGE